MKALSAKAVLKILLANGFVISRQKGSHMILRNPSSGKIVPIPFHGGNKPIHIGTFLAIIQQSELDKNLFM